MKRKTIMITLLAMLLVIPVLAQATPAGELTGVEGNIVVRLAEFRTGRLQWRVSGTATPSSNQSVTIAYDNGAAAGTVIGTANVVNGAWTLSVLNATDLLDPVASGATRIRVISTLGGATTATISIRR